MLVDPKAISPAALYQFMISVVVPRPIAFVSTISGDGRLNAAPFSYFIPLTNEPPLLGISINRRRGVLKDTLRNIEDTGEFVVNVVGEPLAERMVRTSGDWPEDVDEFELTGLTPVASERVKPPRVGESPVSLECRRHQVIELGATSFVVGEILLAHVNDQVLTEGRVDVAKLRPLGRLGGDGYSVVRDVIHLARPRVEPRPA
ncbi:MAG: flavin reductase family protein [Candidatus Eisenbacteria bacterium]|nr:flavin reductase family protein [Candidatus Eisenbacteria bacterium]